MPSSNRPPLMGCIFCNRGFQFDNNPKGVNWRAKAICDGCLLDLLVYCMDKYRDGIKRYIKQEIRLSNEPTG